MDFALTEEHRQAQKMVRDWVDAEVIPTIGEWDRKQEMNPDILPRMGELGILGISIPVRYGGQGFDYITLGLVCEELERADTTLRVVMSVHHGLNSQALLQWGNEAQRQKYLIPQARGEKYAAFCLT
ncbi:MAG: acyl-CoA dehydrogenase family protein, partial [Chloroflexota bacterium]